LDVRLDPFVQVNKVTQGEQRRSQRGATPAPEVFEFLEVGFKKIGDEPCSVC